MATSEELHEELNYVAESAGVDIEYSVEALESTTSMVSIVGTQDTYVVDTAVALEKVKELPDRTTAEEIEQVLIDSHPAD